MSPPIPERYSSLLAVPHQQVLIEVKKRKASTASQVSLASKTSDFIEHKIADVNAGLEYVQRLRAGLLDAWKSGLIPEAQYKEAIADVEANNRPREQEIVVLKRQKKIVTEDLEDQAPSYVKLEDAYASVITNRVMSAVAKRKKNSFNQSKFKADVFAFYQATKMVGEPEHQDKLSYCHLTGWYLDQDVKAAHIVPKSLQSEEVSYLFGVGEAMLSDPRNGMFHRLIVSCSKI